MERYVVKYYFGLWQIKDTKDNSRVVAYREKPDAKYIAKMLNESKEPEKLIPRFATVTGYGFAIKKMEL